MTAAVFNISKAKDEMGKEIEPPREFGPGIIRYVKALENRRSATIDSLPSVFIFSHPKAFQCLVTPRSEKAVTLIRSVLEEHPFEKGDGGLLRNL